MICLAVVICSLFVSLLAGFLGFMHYNMYHDSLYHNRPDYMMVGRADGEFCVIIFIPFINVLILVWICFAWIDTLLYLHYTKKR